MKLRPVIGQTKTGQDFIAFFDGAEDDKPVLKAYMSPDGKKLRIVLPELINFAQVKIDDQHHFLDFTRDGKAAQDELRGRGR